MHVDKVRCLLPQSESVKSIFGVNKVIFSALLDPEIFLMNLALMREFVSTLCSVDFHCLTKTKKIDKDEENYNDTNKDNPPDVLLAFIVISPVFSFVLSCVYTATSS